MHNGVSILFLTSMFLNYCSYYSTLGFGGERDKEKRNNDRDNHNNYSKEYSQKNTSVDESKTIMLKGLPAHTTEPSVTLLRSPKESSEYKYILFCTEKLNVFLLYCYYYSFIFTVICCIGTIPTIGNSPYCTTGSTSLYLFITLCLVINYESFVCHYDPIKCTCNLNGLLRILAIARGLLLLSFIVPNMRPIS